MAFCKSGIDVKSGCAAGVLILGKTYKLKVDKGKFLQMFIGSWYKRFTLATLLIF